MFAILMYTARPATSLHPFVSTIGFEQHTVCAQRRRYLSSHVLKGTLVGCLDQVRGTLRQIRSTDEYFLPSCGSCWRISGLLKIGSKYIQARCKASHASMTSLTRLSWASHRMRHSSNGFLYGLKAMLWVMTALDIDMV